MQIGPWPIASSPGWRQETGAGRMGGAPTIPMAQGPPPDDFSGQRRPPRRPPNGDYAKDRDSGMKSASPDLAVQNMEFFRRAMDKGAISGFTGGAGRLPEISGIYGGRTGSTGRMAGGKLQEIFAKEGTRFCGTVGSIKSGGNILPNLSLYLRLLLREIRNLWVKRAHVALGYYAIFFSSNVTATSPVAIGAIIQTLRTRSI
jgi:hypothetical protein